MISIFSLKSTDNSSPYSYNWDASDVSEGNHTIEVIAYDSYGAETEDEITVEIRDIPVVGIWEGEYSGYDPQTTSDVEIRRRLVINTNTEYGDTIWGKPLGESDFILFELEYGSWRTDDNYDQITWTPTESKRIDINNPGTIENYSQGEHDDPIELNTNEDEWSWRDENLGEDYYLKKQ